MPPNSPSQNQSVEPANGPPVASVDRASRAQTGPIAPPIATVGSRTLEDAVAEMLRPMLREWLDANMPRIVEKAMTSTTEPKA
jgi:uncharacterized protein